MKDLRKTLVVCDPEPIVLEGCRHLMSTCPEIKYVQSSTSLGFESDLFKEKLPDIVLVDAAFGIDAILDWMKQIRQEGTMPFVVVWGNLIPRGAAMKYICAGVGGLLQKKAELDSILECLIAVGAGNRWIDHSIWQTSDQVPEQRPARFISTLTPREKEVVDLLEQGLKNREIGSQLGIQTGTVKIHLKHIFEKTGIWDRYQLAISRLTNGQPVQPV